MALLVIRQYEGKSYRMFSEWLVEAIARRWMNIENAGPFLATIGGGFFVGILIGYALKKIVKIVAIVGGLFFAGLAYLQYQHIANINW